MRRLLAILLFVVAAATAACGPAVSSGAPGSSVEPLPSTEPSLAPSGEPSMAPSVEPSLAPSTTP